MEIKLMKLLCAALLAVNVSCSSISEAQTPSSRVFGSRLAQDLLLRLSDPRGTKYRVGIINTAGESGVLVTREGTPPGAELFSGYRSATGSNPFLSWIAREQLDSSADVVTFEVMRKTIREASCAELEEPTARFFAELEEALQEPIALSEFPPEHRPDTITVDGTSYVLQIWSGKRRIILRPDRDIDVALDRASAALMRAIGDCSTELPGEIEEYEAWR